MKAQGTPQSEKKARLEMILRSKCGARRLIGLDRLACGSGAHPDGYQLAQTLDASVHLSKTVSNVPAGTKSCSGYYPLKKNSAIPIIAAT
jgi:hypothetical protein